MFSNAKNSNRRLASFLHVLMVAGSIASTGRQHTGPIRQSFSSHHTCDREACGGCQSCQPGLAGCSPGACSGAACDKPTLASVIQNAIQPCPDYPAGCMPPDIGAATNNFFGVMGYQAEADDFVFYDLEWVEGTAEPGEGFAFHLNRVVPRLAVEPFPIVVEATGDADLDRKRYQKMVQLAKVSVQTRMDAGEPVVPIHHLGPTHKVVHLPQYGPNYSGTITEGSHGLESNGSNQPSRPVAYPVIPPERLAMLLTDIESRVVVGRSSSDGQISDAFGRRIGFSRSSGQQGQGGRQGGGQGGQGGGGQGGGGAF